MKHRKRERRKKQLKILLILFGIALVEAILTIIHDYKVRPGMLEKVWIAQRGADYVIVAWERPRNVYKYVVTYNGKIKNVGGQKDCVRITGLDEDTEYDFSVRADSKTRKGFESLTASARTKKTQQIQGKSKQMKFMSRIADLNLTAETPVKYKPGNGYIVTEDGKIRFTRSGKVKVKAMTDETEEYAEADKVITVEVIDDIDVDADGAKQHVFYNLNKNNCDCVMAVEGSKTAPIPQSFVYNDGKYIIAYIGKDENNKDFTQRIVTYGDKRTVYKPKLKLWHANGLTIADGRCYSVRGAGSAKCVSFDPPNNNYEEFDMPSPASGIAFDTTTNMFYTSQRNGMVVYDSNFNIVRNVGRVYRKTQYYYQDCGAYGGIMMHCVSGPDYQGTNYIDFYDMINGRYMGSAECALNEVESLIVDEKGYIELLCNTSGDKDYIWKTPINMKMLCD